MDSKIPIIRAFWGTTEYSKKEVLPKPIFSDETVFVWGEDNDKWFRSLGYKTHLMSIYPTDPEYSTVETQYYHKLLVLQKAGESMKEYLFLDWDTFLVRPLDENFYQLLRNGNEVQIPLYAYPDEVGIGLINKMTHPNNRRYQIKISSNLAFFFLGQESQLRKYSWKMENMLISPNFNFCYSRRPSLGTELIQVGKNQDIKYCVEENAMFSWANCDLQQYIDLYEPYVVQGTSDDTRTVLMDWNMENDAVLNFNKYINQIKPKQIYFKHI